MIRRGAATCIAMIAMGGCVGQHGGGLHTAPGLGVEIEAPSNARVEETPGHAFVGNSDDSFALNLFAVDALSAQSAAAQRTELERTPGFVRMTHEEGGAATWRFDYALADGSAGTIARIRGADRMLDCGVHGVTPEVAAAVAAACSRVRPMSSASGR